LDSADSSQNIALMILFVVQILVSCYFNTELSLSSSKLSAGLFHSNWNKGGPRFKKLMQIFQECSKKDIKAFEMLKIDLENFIIIVTRAYALYVFMKIFSWN
jgi:hypothetical protein